MASKASKYQILRMETIGTPPVMNGRVPYVFTDPREAADNARKWAKLIGEKLCVKPLTDGQWRDREYQRLYDGTYRQLPWMISDANWWRSDQAYAIWKDHYPHASLEKPGWLAYTKSVEDGEKDKQSLLRPGAYLNKYFERVLIDYGVSERRLVEEFMRMYGPIDIKFAETEADILKVYEHGPSTCMNGKQWPGNIHPASIYAAGDLQVAYIGDLNGKVSARTLVWPAKKTHSRVYGDIARMTQGLARLGYVWGAPIGARLKRIELYKPKFQPGGQPPHGCFLAPYLDKKNQQGGGHLGVIDKGDHLIICEDNEFGSHHAGQADGNTGTYVPREDEYPIYTCERCGKEVREVVQVYAGPHNRDNDPEAECWCIRCYEDYSWRCEYSGHQYSNDIPWVEVSNNYWLPYYADMYALRCEGDGKLHHKDHIRQVCLADGTKKMYSLDYGRLMGGLFQSQLTNYYYLKSELAKIYGSGYDLYNCSKSELKKRGFHCDGCGYDFLLECRHQTHGDDKLYCPACHEIEKKRPAQLIAAE